MNEVEKLLAALREMRRVTVDALNARRSTPEKPLPVRTVADFHRAPRTIQ
jgi:hypothetical protein